MTAKRCYTEKFDVSFASSSSGAVLDVPLCTCIINTTTAQSRTDYHKLNLKSDSISFITTSKNNTQLPNVCVYVDSISIAVGISEIIHIFIEVCQTIYCTGWICRLYEESKLIKIQPYGILWLVWLTITVHTWWTATFTLMASDRMQKM